MLHCSPRPAKEVPGAKRTGGRADYRPSERAAMVRWMSDVPE